jgi:hypothetical protein
VVWWVHVSHVTGFRWLHLSLRFCCPELELRTFSYAHLTVRIRCCGSVGTVPSIYGDSADRTATLSGQFLGFAGLPLEEKVCGPCCYTRSTQTKTPLLRRSTDIPADKRIPFEWHEYSNHISKH